MSKSVSPYAVLALILALCALSSATAAAEQAPGSTAAPAVKIGAIYNLSGAQAELGRPSLRGAQLAVKQLNAAGGVLGRQLELIAYDGKTDPETVQQQTEKALTTEGLAALIGLSDTDMVLAAAP